MKARTPFMANETLLDGQLHSSGPKMIHFTKLDQVTFKQHYTDLGRYTALTK